MTLPMLTRIQSTRLDSATYKSLENFPDVRRGSLLFPFVSLLPLKKKITTIKSDFLPATWQIDLSLPYQSFTPTIWWLTGLNPGPHTCSFTIFINLIYLFIYLFDSPRV
jgi:hypothetical protein